MTISDYINDCVDFARETEEQETFDVYKHYTTVGKGWEESSNNAKGGVDVAWAFHMSPLAVTRFAPQYFISGVADVLSQAIEEEWDKERMKGIVDLML